MSAKGKLAKIIREIPIGALFRALVLPFLKVGGFWGKLIAWVSPKAVDKIEEAIDDELQTIEDKEAIHDGMAESQRLGDQRPLEDAVTPGAGGVPAHARDGVQTRANRERR